MKLIIVPCGGAKLPEPAPAGRMYIGGYHRAARRAAEALPHDDVLILSAKHGLLELDRRIVPYDLRVGQPGSVIAADVYGQARRWSLLDADVTVIASRAYTELTVLAWPDAALPLAGTRSMGEQMARMAYIRHTGRLPKG